MFEKYRECREEYCQVDFLGSSGKLYVNKGGQVFDVSKGPLVTRFNEKGERVVTANLWDGERGYQVSLLVLLAYGKLKLPTYLLNKVEPFHIDNDPLNCHPSNIGYRFEEPIECREFPGFYHIPFFSDYAISRDGLVLSRISGNFIKGNVVTPTEQFNKKNIKGGYFKYPLKTDVAQTTIGRHRLMMLAFTRFPNNVDRLDVNHKDGIPGNDWLDNLEWLTRSMNNIHAVQSGLRSQNIHCFAKNVYTNEELAFASFAECAKLFKVETGIIAARAASNQKLYKGGWMFKSDQTPWRVPKDPEKELREDSTPTEVKSLNIFTGEQRVHKSIMRCGKELNLKSDQGPKWQLLNGRNQPYYGYLFKYTTDNTPWPEFNSEQLEFYRENPTGRARAVIAFNEKGEEMKFANIKKASEYFKDTLRKPADVAKAIDRRRNVNGWRLAYRTI